MSTFLREAWTQDVTTALNKHEGYLKALGSAVVNMQFVVDDGSDSQVDYYVSTGDGKAVCPTHGCERRGAGGGKSLRLTESTVEATGGDRVGRPGRFNK